VREVGLGGEESACAVVCMKVVCTHHRHVRKCHPEVSLFSLEMRGIERMGSDLV
jgi:hypothetical protein